MHQFQATGAFQAQPDILDHGQSTRERVLFRVHYGIGYLSTFI
jgi:hypothetical protein